MNRDLQRHHESLAKKGWTIREFQDKSVITDHVNVISRELGCDLDSIQQKFQTREEQYLFMEKFSEALNNMEFTKKLFLRETPFIKSLLGPDILIQQKVFLRLQKPQCESDSPGLHRDTFYGNSVEHINFWVPLIELFPGAGLALVEGSHLTPSVNVRHTEYKDDDRKNVSKGSLANKLGFVYAPKIDDSISKLSGGELKIVTPKLGEYLVFFGNMIHGGSNESSHPRVSFDIRFTHPFHHSSVDSQFFTVFSQGVVSQVKEKFLSK